MGSDLRKNFLRPALRAGAQLFPVGQFLTGTKALWVVVPDRLMDLAVSHPQHTHKRSSARQRSSRRMVLGLVERRLSIPEKWNCLCLYMYFDVAIVYPSHIYIIRIA